MPNRIVREGILTSERVDRIAEDPAAEVFYRRLQSVVDDYGLYYAHPSLLRAALYPLRVDLIPESSVTRYLEACSAAGLVRVYSVAGKSYVQVLDFRQRSRAKPRFPLPPDGQLEANGPDGAWRSANVQNVNDGQVTDKCQSIDGRPRAYSYSYSETETGAGHPQPDVSTCEHVQADASTCQHVNAHDKSVRYSTTTTTTNTTTNALSLDVFFEERYSRHPKKRDRALAQQALSEITGIETASVQERFRAGHEAWIATDEYQWKGGAKCPTFASFVIDKTWQYPPDTPKEEPQLQSTMDPETKRRMKDWNG